ncbi:MAG: MerR family DNA-binding transcriptional regulator, partial [Okeania sp. SIO3I5]|uniref:MerR family transcriptional regulator n=1 Tax=Okeania sp. SIO3I5 TaxID=2607805 RepID=UPI0013BA8CCB
MFQMKYVRPKEAASILRVAVSSLRRWDEVGKIKAIKTPSGHRRYSIAEIEQAGGLPRA